MPENIWHGCWSKPLQTKKREISISEITCQAKARVKPFPHQCGCWEVQQYYQAWNCAPMTQKHKFLIVLVGLWGLLRNAMTSFDQTAVQGSSGLQRGEDNPHKHRSSPLRELLQIHLCVPQTLVQFQLLHVQQKNLHSLGFFSLPESALSTWQRWQDYVCISFWPFAAF